MKMIITSALLLVIVATTTAQTRIDKTVPATKGQTLRLSFDYPELVKISTWDKNEVSVTGTVSINGGENDDAFNLDIKTSSNTIYIRNEIKNMDGIPQRVTINEGGTKIVFKSKSEWRKYQEEHGKSNNVNMGIDMDILLEIKVPRNMETNVECTYGLVEIHDFVGPLSVQATYGGVDASLIEKNVGELIAETNYGNIYSNLDMEVNKDQAREEDFHILVRANPGNGPKYRFESPYGNVYLRKSK
ncbi:MAG TPA: hypothetical protein VFE50_21095 [Cyclobacteriaceae bacterium]|nr:hypothetical protein [Cyclobacteriaceae bacterium]